jgi:hypothetical protein
VEILEEEEDAAIHWNINIAKKRYKCLFVVLFTVQSVFLMMLGILRLPPLHIVLPDEMLWGFRLLLLHVVLPSW